MVEMRRWPDLSGSTQPPAETWPNTGKPGEKAFASAKVSTMNDEEAFNYYADPDNREPGGPGRRRKASRSAHVPVRFHPNMIAEIKRFATKDRKTVSSWIRDLVERELELRRQIQTSTASGISEVTKATIQDLPVPKTTTAGATKERVA